VQFPPENTNFDHQFRAGVAGLTTALLLSKKSGYRIVVAAKHMPGDYDIEYASTRAGANYMPLVGLAIPVQLK
jgi:glycine/D-amino acid oxidase-like deaminating enzyme